MTFLRMSATSPAVKPAFGIASGPEQQQLAAVELYSVLQETPLCASLVQNTKIKDSVRGIVILQRHDDGGGL